VWVCVGVRARAPTLRLKPLTCKESCHRKWPRSQHGKEEVELKPAVLGGRHCWVGVGVGAGGGVCLHACASANSGRHDVHHASTPCCVPLWSSSQGHERGGPAHACKRAARRTHAQGPGPCTRPTNGPFTPTSFTPP